MADATPAVTEAVTPAEETSTIPEPTSEPSRPETPAEQAGDQLGDAGKRAIEEERKLRRQAEKAVREAQTELEQLRRAAMTEQERAIVEAREEGRRMAATEWGSKMVDAEIKAVAAGRFSEGQMNVLFQGLNRAAFLKEDGSVDMKSVQEFVEGLAPRPPESKPQSFPDLGQGIRTTDNTALNGDPLLRDLKRHLGIA